MTRAAQRAAVLAALLPALLVVGLPAAVNAEPARTDAEPQVALTVDRDRVRAGQRFTVTARATSRCQWLIVVNGERRVRDGRTAVATFVAPEVARRTRLPVRATCFATQDAASPAPSGSVPAASARQVGHRVQVAVPARQSGVLVVTVLPPGGTVIPPQEPAPPLPPHGPDGLPNAGGPPWWLLALGVGALAGGAGLLRRSSRRATG